MPSKRSTSNASSAALPASEMRSVILVAALAACHPEPAHRAQSAHTPGAQGSESERVPSTVATEKASAPAPEPDRTPRLPDVPVGARQPVALGARTLTAQVCKIDPAGEPMVADSVGVIRFGDVGPDGSVFLLDGNNELRRYRPEGNGECALHRDDAFGEGGSLPMHPNGTASIDRIEATSAGVFVSGDLEPLRRIENGAQATFCDGSSVQGTLYVDGSERRAVLDGHAGSGETGLWLYTLPLTSDAPCAPTAVGLRGAGKSPDVTSIAGDLLVVSSSTEGRGGHDETVWTLHDLRGKRVAKLSPDADGRVPPVVDATGCGDYVCGSDPGIVVNHNLWVWNRRGKLVGVVDLKAATGVAVFPLSLSWHDGTLWVFGAAHGAQRYAEFQPVIVAVSGLQ